MFSPKNSSTVRLGNLNDTITDVMALTSILLGPRIITEWSPLSLSWKLAPVPSDSLGSYSFPEKEKIELSK